MQDFDKKRTLKFKSVAILNEDTTFGTDSAKVQETLAQKYGYAVAAKIAFRAGTTSLDAEVGRMKSANADVFLPSLYTSDAILLTRTMRNLDYNPKLLIAQNAGYTDPKFVTEMGKQAEAAITRAPFALDLAPKKPLFPVVNDMFKKLSGGRDMADVSARAFTGFLTLVDAINRAGSTEPAAIQKLMVFITTTQAEIDGETASRFLFISIDESREMTEKILAKQRHAQTLEGFLGKLKTSDIIRKHKNAGRLLKPLKVVNPYAELLTFTSKTLRARRDNTKYLNLIQAISYLYQYQRKTHTVDYGGKAVEYINVTLADIYKANELAAEILGRSLDELSPPSRKLLLLIRKMCEERAEEGDAQYTFSRRDIREYSGWSDFQVRTHIRQLEELEYIYSLTGRCGKEYVHELVARSGGEDGKPVLIGLVDMEQLKKKSGTTGVSGRTTRVGRVTTRVLRARFEATTSPGSRPLRGKGLFFATLSCKEYSLILGQLRAETGKG